MKQVVSFVVLGLLLGEHVACSFSPMKSFFAPSRSKNMTKRSMSQDDPTDNPFIKFVDGLQKAVTGSPINEGKKALAKMIAGDYDETTIKSKIDNLIEENPVLMLSFTTCPFCLKAKAVLNEKGVNFKAVELDTDPQGFPMRAEMAKMIGRTSVPAIWIGGTFIGGCNDGPLGGIVKLNESGKLDKMLKNVGAL